MRGPGFRNALEGRRPAGRGCRPRVFTTSSPPDNGLRSQTSLLSWGFLPGHELRPGEPGARPPPGLRPVSLGLGPPRVCAAAVRGLSSGGPARQDTEASGLGSRDVRPPDGISESKGAPQAEP